MTIMVIVATATCVVMPAKAQFNFGARVGWALSDLGQGDVEEYLASSSAGIVAEYYLPSSIGFRTGVGYVRKGSALIRGQLTPRDGWGSWGPSDNSPVYMAAGLDYIDIPLQVRYRFSLAERVRLSLGLGGYLGYGFSGKQQVVYTNEFIQTDPFKGIMHGTHPERSLKAFNRTDFGGLLDVEFAYRHFTVGLSGQLGLRDITDKLPVYPNSSARNNTFTISVGYNFK